MSTAKSNPPVDLGSHPKGKAPPRNILIVDDDPAVRQVTQAFLKRLGYTVEMAEDGHAAVRLFSKSTPDAVLLDMFMPGKDGLETITELKRLNPAVRILVMSGSGDEAYNPCLKAARLLGARQIIKKPFLPTDLSAALDAVFSRDIQAKA